MTVRHVTQDWGWSRAVGISCSGWTASIWNCMGREKYPPFELKLWMKHSMPGAVLSENSAAIQLTAPETAENGALFDQYQLSLASNKFPFLWIKINWRLPTLSPEGTEGLSLRASRWARLPWS